MIAAVLIKSPLATFLVSSILELCPPIATVAFLSLVPCNDFLAIALSSCERAVASGALGFELKTTINIADFLFGLK